MVNFYSPSDILWLLILTFMRFSPTCNSVEISFLLYRQKVHISYNSVFTFDVFPSTDIAKVWISLVPEAVNGNLDAIKRLVKDHHLGIREIADKGARGIQGSTMIHTAVHYSDIETVKVYFSCIQYYATLDLFLWGATFCVCPLFYKACQFHSTYSSIKFIVSFLHFRTYFRFESI